MNRISIDFGTSNTQIACLDVNGQPKNIGEIIPTVLYVDGAAGCIHVGMAAVHAYDNALNANKLDASSYYLETFKPDLCLARVNPGDLTVLTGVNGQLMTWLEVLAACFSHFRQFAEEKEFAGASVEEVVLTHPVNFPNLDLYREAALAAGFKKVYFVQEPEAAYLGYKSGGRNLGSKVLVFDMGGGTLDVALLEMVNGAWDVRTQPLRLDTAGYHIDLEICESLRDELSVAGIYSEQGDVEPSFIKYAREQIKELLGAGTLDCVRIRYMSDVTDSVLRGTYTRELFYEVLRRMLEPVFNSIQKYVAALPERPDTVLMVGGSSRLSYVQDELKNLFSDINVFSPADGGSLVARGGMLKNQAPDDEEEEEFEEEEDESPLPPILPPELAIVKLCEREILQSQYDDALLQAVDSNDIGVLNLLLCAGVDENRDDNDRPNRGFFKRLGMGIVNLFMGDYGGYTPLCRAASRGHEYCVRLLLASQNIEVNRQDRKGYAPLHLAAHHGHVGCVMRIMNAAGCDVKLADRYGWTPLHHAAQQGHAECISKLTSRNDVDVNVVTFQNESILHLAAKHNRASAVKTILELPGVNVNATESNGCTALHLAAKEEASDAIEELVRNSKVEVVVKTSSGLTPLRIAAEKGNVKMVQLLRDARPDCVNDACECGYTPLLAALRSRRHDCVETLLETPGINVNIADKDGDTPLIYAVRQGDESMVKKLLDFSDIDVNLKNNSGETALHLAIHNDYLAIFQCLLADSRTDVNVSRGEDSPLYMTIYYYGRTAYLKSLLEHPRIRVNCRTPNGNSLLEFAMEQNRTECIDLLRQNGIR